jgi:DNA-binding NtrC family response regulator
MKTALIFSINPKEWKPVEDLLKEKFLMMTFDNIEKGLFYMARSCVDLIFIEDAIDGEHLQRLFGIINNSPQKIPVIISTSEKSIQTVVKYMKLGASEIIFQPYEASTVLKLVETLVAPSEKISGRKIQTYPPIYYHEHRQNLNPNYINKMSKKKYIQSVTAELKGRVLNSEITFDEALGIYEDRIKHIYAI